MLAATGVFFLALSAASFFLRLKRGLYSRHPYEQYLFVGAALLFGLLAVLENPGALTLALSAFELGAAATVVRYIAIGSRFPSQETTLKPGERFPDFALPDSEGGTFVSRSLQGSSAALYIFFRGHF